MAVRPDNIPRKGGRVVSESLHSAAYWFEVGHYVYNILLKLCLLNGLNAKLQGLKPPLRRAVVFASVFGLGCIRVCLS